MATSCARQPEQVWRTLSSLSVCAGTMSLDDADPLRRLQVAIDAASREDVPDNVYLDACNALKELYSLSKLYKVTYYEFVVELGDHGPVVSSRLRTRILPQDDDDASTNQYLVRNWQYVLDRGSLPRDMAGLPFHKPFAMGDGRGLVTECVPYLKRQREAEENSE